MLELEKYSIGMGDRFGRQGEAQLRALVNAREAGIAVVPVWNKSNREHTLIGTRPESVLREAEAAVRALGWKSAFYVDADHIGLKTVDAFIESSNFFTLDVADFIGKPAAPEKLQAFVDRMAGKLGKVTLPVLNRELSITRGELEQIAAKYLDAVSEAGQIYRHIEQVKGRGSFVTEVSMDETTSPQTPAELLVILAAIAEEGIPAQTIAPKFSGEFHKGVDYIGDVAKFEAEFEADLAVVALAVAMFGLPPTLKLSVHSGSDKFSIYPGIRKALVKFDAGLHLKTAGTTWLEEAIGLAAGGGDGLVLVKEIYRDACKRFDELCAPYATVVRIDRAALPSPETVAGWTSDDFVSALKHDQKNPRYDHNLRQLMHIAFKLAAEAGERYFAALDEHAATVNAFVTANLWERHVKPLFIGGAE